MLTLSIAAVSVLIGLLTGAFATVAGLVVVILLTAAIVAAGCALAGLGAVAALVQVVVAVVSVQVGYGMQTIALARRVPVLTEFASGVRALLHMAIGQGGSKSSRRGDNAPD